MNAVGEHTSASLKHGTHQLESVSTELAMRQDSSTSRTTGLPLAGMLS